MEEIITMREDRVCFEAGGRKLTLHKAGKSGAPLIVLNNFASITFSMGFGVPDHLSPA